MADNDVLCSIEQDISGDRNNSAYSHNLSFIPLIVVSNLITLKPVPLKDSFQGRPLFEEVTKALSSLNLPSIRKNLPLIREIKIRENFFAKLKKHFCVYFLSHDNDRRDDYSR